MTLYSEILKAIKDDRATAPEHWFGDSYRSFIGDVEIHFKNDRSIILGLKNDNAMDWIVYLNPVRFNRLMKKTFPEEWARVKGKEAISDKEKIKRALRS